MYIHRELQGNILSYLNSKEPRGIILSGIVGCGKTTLVQNLLKTLASDFEIFTFTGDDIQFRNEISYDSYSLLRHVQSKTTRRSLIFVDEVQKTEAVFDALKIAFDSKQISFIVSGSNPAFLSSIAKKRLQRRAYQFQMLPFSLAEILVFKKFITPKQASMFSKFLESQEPIEFDQLQNLTLTDEVQTIADHYFIYGGLPLVFLAKSTHEKLMELRLTTERGFELFSTAQESATEKIKIELARLQSQEFTYKNIFDKTRSKSRDMVNGVIDDLINHGYLVKKKPTLLKEGKTSYLSVYSYIDPGIATYLNGQTPTESQVGFWLEGYIHARLEYLTQNIPSRKHEIGYYKDHTIDSNGKTKFHTSGEIDFVLQHGKKPLPLEVKHTSNLGHINTAHLEKFMSAQRCAYGIVIYGGVPHFDQKRKLIFWPYWLI